MSLNLALVSLLALGGVKLSTDHVPAQGAQEALLTLDRTTMVHLSATGPSGTACSLVDILRGPFLSAGTVGSVNCDGDQLLEAGSYKLRLESPAKGKGKVVLKAEPFVELNPIPVKLEAGRTTTYDLHPGQQATFWIHLASRQAVNLLVRGRTVGEVAFWRTGEWREARLGHADVKLDPDRPVHEWSGGPMLEAGDYLFTTYGTAAKTFAKGAALDSVLVAYEGDPVGPERIVQGVLPPLGAVAMVVPADADRLMLERTGGDRPLGMEVQPLNENTTLGMGHGRCEIPERGIHPECSLAPGSEGRRWVYVTGEPGTAFELTWTRTAPGGTELPDGIAIGNEVSFRIYQQGSYVVGTTEPGADDESPLACALAETQVGTLDRYVNRAIGFDGLVVEPKHPFQRSFNFNGNAQIWFDLTERATWHVKVGGERKEDCELFSLEDDNKWKLRSSGVGECDLVKDLPAGRYLLKLYGGNPGIEKLLIAAPNNRVTADESPTKGGCQIRADLEPGVYRLELSRAASGQRALVLRTNPTSLDQPLPVRLEQGGKVDLTVASPVAWKAETRAGVVSCDGAAASARCKLASSQTHVTLTNPGTRGLTVWVTRDVPRPPPPALLTEAPPLQAVTEIRPDAPLYLDYDRGETHSFVVKVTEPGLYDAVTTGLLGTRCVLRSALVDPLAADGQGGRGRNCLVSQYLRAGRYLLTVQAQNLSAGRAGLVLTRRGVRQGPAIESDGQAFFTVPERELLAEKLTVPRGKGGRYALSTQGLAGALSCRLEDSEGWPLSPVPTPCVQNVSLKEGTYRWMQLPLSVPSARHTQLARVLDEPTLTGEKTVHDLGLNHWYDAELGRDGEDEFRFVLASEIDLHIALTNAMQGHLFSEGADHTRKAIQVLAPQDVPAPVAAAQPDPEPQPEPDPQPVDDAPPPSDDMQPDSNGDDPQPPPPPPAPRPQPSRASAVLRKSAPGVPPGQVVHLTPGTYVLTTQHSRGDVHIRYQLQLATDTLIPGVSIPVQAPAQLLVRVPREGTVRLRSTGDTDVRCRLFDSKGKLVTESGEIGDDWNCGIAEPLPAGDYTLQVESETLQPGPTVLSLSEPEVTDLGVLKPAVTVKLGDKVAEGALPPLAEDGVQEALVRGKSKLSCALVGPDGAVVGRQGPQLSCAFLLRPGKGNYRLRVWPFESTSSSTAEIEVTPRALVDVSGSIPAGSAGRAAIGRAGRFETSPGVLCLRDGLTGPLQSCGPAISLEAGAYDFAAVTGRSLVTPLSLKEIEVPFDGEKPEIRFLSERPFLARTRGPEGLYWLKVVAGEGKGGVSCALLGGATRLSANRCEAAAMGPGATLKLLADAPVQAHVEKGVLPLPSHTSPLQLGASTVAFEAGGARLAAPVGAWRAELSLPAGTWAAQRASDGQVIDLCPASDHPAACALEGTGGEVLVASAGEGSVDALVVILDGAPAAHRLDARAEWVATAPGSDRWEIRAENVARVIEVEGAAACGVRQDDGTRREECASPLPAGRAATLEVKHGIGALRATVRAIAVTAPAARFGALPGLGGSPLALGAEAALGGAVVQKQIQIAEPSVVRVESSAGSCALGKQGQVLAQEGLASGCVLFRLLDAGTYQLIVRAFGEQPLQGRVSWSAQPVETLADGVGPERTVGPGQSRFFRFTTVSEGQVGIGLQVGADTLSCQLMDANQKPLGQGCQQFATLPAGSYLLQVGSPRGGTVERFRPVVLGLAGAHMDVPEDYLRDLFSRAGVTP